MPPLSREVLDSEDEDDLVPLKPRSPVATLHGGEDAPLDTLMDVDRATTSTASTAEQLRLAHKALMEPTQDAIDVSNAAIPISPTSSRKKRPLIDDKPEPRSSGKLKRIKAATDDSSSHPIELTEPGPTFPDPTSTPIIGTYDTIPGQTFPSLSTSEHNVERETPKTRTRKSSQQHASSAEHNSSLTPWSVSAIDSSDYLNSEDAAIGLPKEMYKPRASRSRSHRVESMPTDYSKPVEKTIKKVVRAKTDTKDASNAESIFPPRPILEAPEMERLSPSPVNLDTASIQLEDTIAETPAEVIHQEPPPSSVPQKNAKKAAKTKQPGKRGRPKKQPVTDEQTDDQDELAPGDEIAVAKVETIPKAEVQVLISTSRPKPASCDATMSTDNPELLHSILAGLGHKSTETTPQPAPAPEKTTKRGRKGKITKTKASEAPVDVRAVEEETAPEPELEPESKPEPEVPEEPAEPAPAISAPKPTSGLETAGIKTPQTTKKAAAKTSPSKPSWQRTPYRVGLSKSQRIPSLLKVFKK